MEEFDKTKLDKTKIDWYVKFLPYYSELKVGVYPEGTTKEEVEKLVRGPFGGRFERFGNGEFSYVAYTD